MAIVTMSKVKLISLTYHKDNILNALHKTGSVEIIATNEIEDTLLMPETEEKNNIIEKLARFQRNIDFLENQIYINRSKDYCVADKKSLANNFLVKYNDFISIIEKEEELTKVINKLEELSEKLTNNRLESDKLETLRLQLNPYRVVEGTLNSYKDTKNTKAFLGTIKKDEIENLKSQINELSFSQLSVLSEDDNNSVVLVVSHVEEYDNISKVLADVGFNQCPFNFECSAKDKLNEIDNEINTLAKAENEISKEICEKCNYLTDIKILTDYYKFQIEKLEDSERFRCTAKTFVMEGYLPEEKKEDVLKQVKNVTNAVFVDFSKPEKGDNPPTLLSNNKVIKQSEFITELYSMPAYNEMDPSKVVFFFFMFFMGLIMADIGYGIVMIILGFSLARRIKVDNGARRLWNIVGISGFFAIIFGFLFNSFFGFTMPFVVAVLPSPIPDQINGMTGLMTILLLCLLLGVIQIAVGYFCKAINLFKQKDILGGICEGIIWVLFFIGVIFATFNFLLSYLMPEGYANLNPSVKEFFNQMAMPGIYTVIVTLGLAVFTAGRHEKGFGKFSKGFGAVYGLISIMSDILSYARLFGLMLSGMIIAGTFNDIGLGMMTGGVGYILGILVMIIGHAFNLAMGVLGAYIHDSRLQYIEFFGKFYTGEGNKFTPLGSKFNYIHLVDLE